jgi:hypothetical protein
MHRREFITLLGGTAVTTALFTLFTLSLLATPAAAGAGSFWWMGQPGCPLFNQTEADVAQSAPCKAISSSRLYAAFQSHLVQATRMISRGSSRSR